MFFDILKRITEMLMVQEMKKQLHIKWILFHYTVMHHLITVDLNMEIVFFFSELEYDSVSKVRIFNDLMSYAMRKNDYNSGTQLNLSNFDSLYPLIFFDLSFQMKVTRDPKQLTFRYRLSANANQNFSVHAVVYMKKKLLLIKLEMNLS